MLCVQVCGLLLNLSRPTSNFGLSQWLFEFRVFAARCAQQVGHMHRFTGISREKRGAECNVSDVATGQVQACEPRKVQTVRRSSRRKNAAPDFLALRCVWKRKLHDKTK